MVFHSAALFGKGGAKTRQESFLRCRMIIRLVKNVFGRGISVTEDMMETLRRITPEEEYAAGLALYRAGGVHPME